MSNINADIKRIGYLPRKKVLEIIDNLTKEEALSRSKVVGLLVEEALNARGLLGNQNLLTQNKISRNVDNRNKTNLSEINLNENDFVDDSGYMSNNQIKKEDSLSEEVLKISKIVNYLKNIGEI